MTLRLAVPVLIAALGLAGCGASGGVADMPPAHDTGAATDAALPGLLAGRTFLSTSSTGKELVDGSHITLSFNDDGSVGANAGCNHMGGTPVWDGDVLAVPEMYMTEMACAQPLMEQEGWFAGLLAGGVAVALTGATLSLAADGVTLDLLDRRIADPDRPLAGTTWTLEGITGDIGGSSSFSPVPGGLTVTLRIGADRLDVFNGLTWMSAPLAAGQDLSAASGTVHVAGALAGDGVGCESGGTDCVVDVSVLGSDFDYAITAGSLEISGTGSTEGAGLTFRTDDPADPPAAVGLETPAEPAETSVERTAPAVEPGMTSAGWQPTATSQ